MKKILFTLAAALVCLTAGAQAVGQAELQEIRGSFVKDASTKAVQNALTHEKNIKAFTYNFDKVGTIDHFFKYRCDVSGITNQLSSGRCWMFTSMNVLRPTVMKKYNLKEFDFSHNYTFFWDQFEKANLFLENVIATADRPITDRDVEFFFKSPVADGGVWNLFWDAAEKYGVVPQSVMPETEHSNNTAQMRGVLNELLRTGGWHLRELIAGGAKKKAVEAKKIEILKDVYRVLALCLGEPPTEFTWRYRDAKGQVQTLKTTPLEFYKSIIPEDYNPDTFIMIMNDPTREYYKVYDIASYRNTYEGVNWCYLNLPNEEIKPAALASIKDNTPLYISCDVGKQSDREKGIMDVDY
ncbi:MAG: biotin transporter BioY, partial [Bacteroidales bacterium]|nr:biotin transporter BioY [Bacteroidales bacterium]